MGLEEDAADAAGVGAAGFGSCFCAAFCAFVEDALIAGERWTAGEEGFWAVADLALSWKRLAGAVGAGLSGRPFCSVLTCFCFCAASGSSDRLLTPAAALFGVSLKRSDDEAPFGVCPGGAFAGVLFAFGFGALAGA